MEGWGWERGGLITPWNSAADSGRLSCVEQRGQADSSVAKYTVKHKDLVSYVNKCLKNPLVRGGARGARLREIPWKKTFAKEGRDA